MKSNKDNRTPDNYFLSRDRHLPDSRMIVESIFDNDYTTTKALMYESLYKRLEEKEHFIQGLKKGGSEMEKHLFGT
jgi:hypothetical protein